MSAKNSKPSIHSILLILLITGFGVFARTSHLNTKFYWIDEVSSSFIITGNSPEVIDHGLSSLVGKSANVQVVLNFLESDLNATSKDLIVDLAIHDPQHSPLYLLLGQKWAQAFGAQFSTLRILAALLGALSLPCLAWLLYELFLSRFTAMVGTALLTIAPFHILYSQQNREYGLWFTVTLFSTAALLYANRTRKTWSWILYGVSVSLGLYSFLFFVPFFLSHGLFQYFYLKQTQDKKWKPFCLSAFFGFFSFAPWLVNILYRSQMVQDLNRWSSNPVDHLIYVQGLLLNISRLFVDFNLPSFRHLPWQNPQVIFPVCAVVALIFYSLILVLKKLDGAKRILLSSMIAVPFLFLFGMDVAKGGIHALVGRHLMPSWIGIYVAVSFCVAQGLIAKSKSNRFASLASLILLLGYGVQFCFNYLPARDWWPLKPKETVEAADAFLSSNAEALAIAQPLSEKNLLSFVYFIKSDTPLIVLDSSTSTTLISQKVIAIYKPSEEILNSLKGDFEVKRIAADLWLASRKSKISAL